MERSLRFYRDLLGLEVRSDEMQPIGGMPTLYANPETSKRRAVNLRYGKSNDHGFLVLSERPGGTRGEAIKLDQVGISHFSWWGQPPRRGRARALQLLQNQSKRPILLMRL